MMKCISNQHMHQSTGLMGEPVIAPGQPVANWEVALHLKNRQQ